MNPYSPTSIQALTYKTPQQIIAEATAGNTAPATSITSAPGAMQYANGGQASMVSPVISAPAVTKTGTTATTPAYTSAAAVPVAEPTIGSTLGTSTAGATTPTSTLRNPTYEQADPVLDENKIRRQQTKLFQREIDATNQVYKQLLNEARVEGQGRLGSQTAQSARGGLLGSDFASTQEQKVRDVNTGITTALQNERIAKIGAIQGKVRESVASELTRKREELQTSAKARKELKTNNLKLAASAFLTQGIDPMTLSQEELMAIGQEAGLTPNEIINQYVLDKAEQDTATAKAELGTRKTEAEISKIEADIAKGKVIELAEGGMLYNTETGETFKNPKTYAPGTGSSSALSLTREDKQTLLGGGWSEGDISTIEADVRAYGLTEVINQAKANGATQSEINALQKAYGASADTTQFLTKDYFKSLFGTDKLAEAAQAAGTVTGGNDYIPFNESGDTEAYLTQLESTVNLYRQAGYTDQEILKMMQ